MKERTEGENMRAKGGVTTGIAGAAAFVGIVSVGDVVAGGRINVHVSSRRES